MSATIQNDVAKVKGKHLVFKTSIARIHIRLLIDNGSEAELIDKIFANLNKINTFQLKNPFNLRLAMVRWYSIWLKGALWTW